jgi:hypothetical protein
MRMGDFQKFDSLLDDFEFKLALYKGAEWPDRNRIFRLNAMINAKLLNASITIDFPDNDYQSWVIRTRKIATKLEARSGYVTNKNVATWFIKKKGSSAFFSRPQTARSSPKQPNTPTTDSNGDIQITEVNNAIINLFVAGLVSTVPALKLYTLPALKLYALSALRLYALQALKLYDLQALKLYALQALKLYALQALKLYALQLSSSQSTYS